MNETKRYNWANGDTQQYTYDALDRISRRDVLDGATNVSYEIYGRDAMHRITLIDREGANDDRFGYYDDGELYWATYGAAALNDGTYLWDKAGNRTQVADGGVWTTYTPDAINQYTAVGGATISNNAEHQISAYNGITFGYYADGRVSWVFNGSTWIDFYYDALGRCVKRVRDGWDAKYNYYDGEKEILECGPAGGVAFKNVYGKGIDEVVARTNTSLAQTVYYQQDQNGNVTQLTDSNGIVVEKYQYDAFGAPIIYNGFGTQISVSNFGNPLLFTGRRYQPTFGIYEYRARAYHPKLGRFMSEDPKLFDAGDYNLFRYCHNDPLDLTDPMGLETNWSGAGPQNPENHASAERYAEMMGDATRRALRNNPSAGAIGIGSAGYQAWSAAGGLSLARVSVQKSPSKIGERIATASESKVGSTEWAVSASRGDFGPGDNKCQLFVAEMAREGGAFVPLMKGNNPFRGYPPNAGDWGNKNLPILGWKIVETPHRGDVVAIRLGAGDAPNATGHAGIYTGNRTTVSASHDAVVRNSWGFRQGQAPVFRTFVGFEMGE